MRSAMITASLLFGTACGPAAHAAVFTYIIGGTVSADVYGEGSYFGDNVTGATFSAQFDVDDNAPNAIYDQSSAGSSAQGGGLIKPSTRPPVTATLTINGRSDTIQTGDRIVRPIDYGGETFGPSLRERDAGFIFKQAAGNTLLLGAKYDESSACCADYGSYYSTTLQSLDFTLSGLGLNSPDYRQAGTFVVSGTGQYSFDYEYATRSGGILVSRLFKLTPTTLSVSGGVPEPATWAMMMLGFGAIGYAMRRQKAHAAARFT